MKLLSVRRVVPLLAVDTNPRQLFLGWPFDPLGMFARRQVAGEGGSVRFATAVHWGIDSYAWR